MSYNRIERKPKAPKKIVEIMFKWYLEYLASLDSEYRNSQPAWAELRRTLTKLGFWKEYPRKSSKPNYVNNNIYGLGGNRK